MNPSLRSRRSFPAVLALVALVPMTAVAQGDSSRPLPSGDAPPGPRSRLTMTGLYETDTYSEKNFFLGARGGAAQKGEFDAFWTQRLNLRPRFILSDDCNINLSVDLAQGIWGSDGQPLSGKGAAESAEATPAGIPSRPAFLDLRLNRAYLALRHPGTRTRWYLGRQEFGLGNLLVLDCDAPGLQLYRDFGTTASIGLGFAKETESGSLGDFRQVDGTQVTEGRDADLYFAEWRKGRTDAGLHLNPFFVWYVDRGNASGTTWLPDGQELGARFRPHVTRAQVFGLAARYTGGRVGLEMEFDYLKGVDRIGNRDSGPNEAHDVNNGDLKGMNGYGRLTLRGSRLEIALTGARGAGDPDPFRDQGTLNALRTDGRWALTEIWGNGWTLAERGLAPTGLANPYVRGTRGLENTTLYQGALSYRLRPNLSIGASFSLIRATEILKGWSDVNGDGSISMDEYGIDPRGPKGESTELGSEIDGRIDWRVHRTATVSLRGGIFSPGPAAGYLIHGTAKYQESPFLLHLGVSVPIPEFSLGG